MNVPSAVGAARRLTPDLPFRDPAIPIEVRVSDLISRLTVEEKIGQLMMTAPAIPRLDIPAHDWWSEALHGVARNGIATVFPQAIALAATWNPALHGRIAAAIGTEARAKHNDLIRRTGGATARYEGLTLWSPNINIFRDPRWGRGQETYGEDPLLTARFGVAFVRGLQGDDPHYYKTVATVKHYAVHSGPEESRHRFNAIVSERDLHETYLPAFEACIREGGAGSLMSAYNAIGGVPAPANRRLLSEILRERWGFEGAVVGDVDTVADLHNVQGHHFARDAAEASSFALKAGNDLCSGTTYAALPAALARGLATEADLDVALRRLFRLRFKLGQFDPPERVPYTTIPFSANDSPAHDQLALEAARQSLVLLKNDGTLPWHAGRIKTLAVLGPTANDFPALTGNYSGTPARPVTILKGLRHRLEPLGVKILADSAVPLVHGFRESCHAFPDNTLFTDESQTTAGLRGEVFSQADFQGECGNTRIDEQIDLRWNEYAPLPGIPLVGGSVRWSGVLVAPASGEYLLTTVVVGGVRLTLDQRVVIDAWLPGKRQTQEAPVTLVAGKSYAVCLEYAQTENNAEVTFGWKPPGDHTTHLARAVTMARAADHILLTLGITPTLEGEEMFVDAEGFRGGDRTSVQLPYSQRELLAQVAALGKPFTVVFTGGSALSFDHEKPNAVLFAWYYGQRGGDAVADVLLGETNPAGRLPVTFYASDSDLPPFDDYAMANRTYRYFTGRPLYAFGHGLSYTTFAYEKLTLTVAAAGAGAVIDAEVTVTNTGDRAGDEVVQLYASALNPPVPMPRQWLVGFQRISLQVGETQTVRIAVPRSALQRWDEVGTRYVVDPGTYEFCVGPASDRIPIRRLLNLR